MNRHEQAIIDALNDSKRGKKGRPPRLRPNGYRATVEWIALNDSPGDAETAENMIGYLSVATAAFVFKRDQRKVAIDVWNYRQEQSRSGTEPRA